MSLKTLDQERRPITRKQGSRRDVRGTRWAVNKGGRQVVCESCGGNHAAGCEFDKVLPSLAKGHISRMSAALIIIRRPRWMMPRQHWRTNFAATSGFLQSERAHRQVVSADRCEWSSSPCRKRMMLFKNWLLAYGWRIPRAERRPIGERRPTLSVLLKRRSFRRQHHGSNQAFNVPVSPTREKLSCVTRALLVHRVGEP